MSSARGTSQLFLIGVQERFLIRQSSLLRWHGRGAYALPPLNYVARTRSGPFPRPRVSPSNSLHPFVQRSDMRRRQESSSEGAMRHTDDSRMSSLRQHCISDAISHQELRGS